MGWQDYGCDICQDVCPFNRNAPVTQLTNFQPRIIFQRSSGSAEEKIPQGLKAREDKPPMSELKLRPPKGSLAPEHAGESLLQPSLEWLAGMSEEEFREVFRGSAVKRAKWAGLVRNACVALGNADIPRGSATYDRIMALLTRLAELKISTIAESARWASHRIQQGRG